MWRDDQLMLWKILALSMRLLVWHEEVRRLGEIERGFVSLIRAVGSVRHGEMWRLNEFERGFVASVELLLRREEKRSLYELERILLPKEKRARVHPHQNFWSATNWYISLWHMDSQNDCWSIHITIGKNFNASAIQQKMSLSSPVEINTGYFRRRRVRAIEGSGEQLSRLFDGTKGTNEESFNYAEVHPD